jgi:hypothetical protein
MTGASRTSITPCRRPTRLPSSAGGSSSVEPLGSATLRHPASLRSGPDSCPVVRNSVAHPCSNLRADLCGSALNARDIGGPKGRDACVARVATHGDPGLARSTDREAQWAEGRGHGPSNHASPIKSPLAALFSGCAKSRGARCVYMLIRMSTKPRYGLRLQPG